MTNEQIGRGKLDEGKRSVVFGRRTEVMMKNEDVMVPAPLVSGTGDSHALDGVTECTRINKDERLRKCA